MEITRTLEEQVRQAEIAYTTYSKSIPDSRWGENEENELGRRYEVLQRLYEQAGTDEYDRVQ